jgi:hypothetical protein
VPDATLYRVLRSTTTSVADGAQIGSTTSTSFEDTTALPNLEYRYWLQVSQAGGTSTRLTTALDDGEPGSRAQPPCNDVDFNNNTVFPEDQDIIDFFASLAGAECASCDSVDFNNNGIFPEDQDIVDFFASLAGASC